MILYWKPIAAVLLLVMAFWGGFKTADDRAELAQTKRDLATATRMLNAERDARENDAELLRKAEARMASLDVRIEEMEVDDQANPESSRECLDARDIDQLRDLWVK